MKSALILILSVFLLCEAFDKDVFLESCKKDPSFRTKFYIRNIEECLICSNVAISKEDSETFKAESLAISDEKCIVFDEGDVGVVNGDFFKQFPETKKMVFQNVNLSLASSQNENQHENMEVLGIVFSNINENLETNALHSLVNLDTFALNDNLLESTNIDKTFFEKNPKLRDVTLMDTRKNPPLDKSIPFLSNINEEIFENNPDLEKLSLKLEKMSILPTTLLTGKTKFQNAELSGQFTEFPDSLPESTKHLTLSDFVFKKLSKANFEKLSNLEMLSMYRSELEEVDEDAFENLEKLTHLNLGFNKIKNISENVFKNAKNLKSLVLKNNPMDEDYISSLEKDVFARG